MQGYEDYVPVPGAHLWTVRQGDGPAVICCHGGPGLWDYLGPVAAMLDDQATVYRYDQRACGRSTGDPPYTVATAVADLEALRQHWQVSDWVVLGHSWGATLALAYAAAYPTATRAVVYISGTGVDPSWHAVYHANRAARLTSATRAELARLEEQRETAVGIERQAIERAYCLHAWSTDFSDRMHAYELAQQLLVDDFLPNYVVNSDLGNDAARYAEGGELAAQLPSLPMPMLVIHGAADPRPTWAAEQVAAVVPNARLAILPDCGHLPWIEQPDAFQALLKQFIRNTC